MTAPAVALKLKDRLADARLRVHVLERKTREASVELAQPEAEYDRAVALEKRDTECPSADTAPDLDGGWS